MATVSTGLELRDLSHRFAERMVVDHLNLSIAPGEICCLLGPSGCGKTTTLRIVAGLESIQSGTVSLDGEVIASPGHELPPERRRIGMVFPDYALFPPLPVQENVAFGLQRQRDREARALGLLQRLHVDHLASQFPHRLSGGEQQRVALARALAPEPRAMLLDEPFANLDARLRAEVRDDTLAMLQGQGTATLMVTHDPAEALRMADRLAIMQNGKLEQIGPPDEVFSHPANRFCAEFLSEFSVLEGQCEAAGEVVAGPFRLSATAETPGSRLDVLVRPEALCFRAGPGEAGAKVVRVRNLGPMILIDDKVGPEEVPVRGHWGDARRPRAGDLVGATLVPEKVFVFARKTP